MGYIPYQPYNQGGTDAVQLALYLSSLNKGKQKPKQQGGGGLGKLLGGGAGGAVAADQAGLLGGASEMGSMSLPEIESLVSSGGLPMSMGAPAATEGGMSMGASGAAGASMLPLAGVVAAPIVGRMLGDALSGPSVPTRSYDSNEMLKHNKFGQRFKGFDQASDDTKRKVADILGAQNKGRTGASITAGAGEGQSNPMYDFLPMVGTDMSKVFDRLKGMSRQTDNPTGAGSGGWGNRQYGQDRFNGYDAQQMYDATKPDINQKSRSQIEDRLKQIQDLIAQAGQMTQAPKLPVSNPTPAPRTVDEIRNMPNTLNGKIVFQGGMIPKAKSSSGGIWG